MDNEPVFTVHLDEGVPQFTFSVFDHTDEPVVQVERNVVAFRRRPWDVELRGKFLKVYYKHRCLLMNIKLDASTITFEKLVIYRRGSMLLFTPDDTLLYNNQLSPVRPTYMQGNIIEPRSRMYNLISIRSDNVLGSILNLGEREMIEMDEARFSSVVCDKLRKIS